MKKADAPLYERIMYSIVHNPKARLRAIVLLYQGQTMDEQAHCMTKHHNKIGFDAADALKGTYLAKKILSNRKLSTTEFILAGKIATKYAGTQLLSIAKEKHGTPHHSR